MEANPGSLIGSGRARRPGRTVVLAVLCSASLALPGCGPMDTGQAEANYITELFADDPRVSEVDVNGQTKLPWTPGNVSGTIHAEPGLSEEEVTELVYRIGDHQENTRTGSSASNLRIDVEGVVMGVSADREAMGRTLPVLFELRDDENVESANVTTGEVRSSLTIEAIGPEAVMPLTRTWSDNPPLLQAAGFVSDYRFTVSADDKSYVVEGTTGRWWEPGFDAWTAVANEFSLTAASVVEGVVELRVAADSEIDGARALAQETVGPAVRVTVSGGLLSIADGADGSLGRIVINALPDNITDLITGAATNDVELTIGVVAPEAVRTVGEALLQIPEAHDFDAIRIGSPSLEVGATPDALMEWIGLFDDVRANTTAERIHVDQVHPNPRNERQLGVHFSDDSPATVEEMEYLARLLRPHASTSTMMRLTLGLDRRLDPDLRLSTVLFDATPYIDTDSYPVKGTMEKSQRFTAFVDIWNRS